MKIFKASLVFFFEKFMSVVEKIKEIEAEVKTKVRSDVDG
jgi:hypothetical protein